MRASEAAVKAVSALEKKADKIINAQIMSARIQISVISYHAPKNLSPVQQGHFYEFQLRQFHGQG